MQLSGQSRRLFAYSRQFTAWRTVYKNSFNIDMDSYTDIHKHNDHKLKIQWTNTNDDVGKDSFYDFAWLRDNCNCNHCVDPASGQKTFNREHVITSFPTHV